MSNSFPIHTPGSGQTESRAKQTTTVLPEEVEILNVVNKFLGCISKKDPTTMLSLVLSAGSATLIRRGTPVHLTLEAVVKGIPFDSPIHMDEQTYNSSVHVDGELGVAWTLYVFYEDGKLNRTETNIFSMWKMKERGWVITGVADIANEVDEGAFDAFGEAEMWEREQGEGEGGRSLERPDWLIFCRPNSESQLYMLTKIQ